MLQQALYPFRLDHRRIRFGEGVAVRGKPLLGGLHPEYSRAPPAGSASRTPLSTGLRELCRSDLGGLLPLRAIGHLERDALVFFERLESSVLNFRDVREKILAAAVGRDEAVALRVVEPLDGSCCHV